MRAVRIAEEISRGGGDDSNVDVDLAILNRLPAAAMRAQHARSAHVPVRAEVAQRPIQAAFDVMHRARLHQLDHRLMTGERSAGKPPQVFHAHACRGLQRRQRHLVAIAEVMVAADGHAVAQVAEAQCSLQVGRALIAVERIIAVAANRRRRLTPAGRMTFNVDEGRLFAAVHNGWNAATQGVGDKISGQGFAHCASPGLDAGSDKSPIRRARSINFRARCTTGGSIIFEPTLTTPSPCA